MMRILTAALEKEQDVVTCRQTAHKIAALLGFDGIEQTRIATAASELARNAYEYAKGGKVEFAFDAQAASQLFVIKIHDKGPGIAQLQAILDGHYQSPTGMGLGLIGAKRLMDRFEITYSPAGTHIVIAKAMPSSAARLSGADIGHITASLAKEIPHSLLSDMRHQNQELFQALQELEKKRTDLERLNQELAETNRGVVALYAELDEHSEKLKRADEVKTRFLSHMSHEFRTPLHSALRITSFLLDRSDGELNAEQEKQVRLIQKSMENLAEMVNDLLDLAKVEAGRVSMRVEDFSVSELFGSLRGLFRPLNTNPGLDLRFERPGAIPRLKTDEGKVSQILRNFVSNALKFTESGEIRVRAKYNARERRVMFNVSDTGIGIAPQHIDHVFEEFSQIENPIQKNVKGTGLGLPLSKKLAELLGGTIGVESELQKGSTFFLEIPLEYQGSDVEEPQLIEELETPGHSVATGIRALIIDDEEASCYSLKRALAASGYEVYEARDCEAGLRYCRENAPSIIFLDLMMPYVDGFETLSCLKSIAVTKNIPVIIHSSKLLTPEERRTLKPLTHDILHKGMTYEELIMYIKHVSSLLLVE